MSPYQVPGWTIDKIAVAIPLLSISSSDNAGDHGGGADRLWRIEPELALILPHDRVAQFEVHKVAAPVTHIGAPVPDAFAPALITQRAVEIHVRAP